MKRIGKIIIILIIVLCLISTIISVIKYSSANSVMVLYALSRVVYSNDEYIVINGINKKILFTKPDYKYLDKYLNNLNYKQEDRMGANFIYSDGNNKLNITQNHFNGYYAEYVIK